MRVTGHSLEELDALRAEIDPLVEASLVKSCMAAVNVLTADASDAQNTAMSTWSMLVDQDILPHVTSTFDGASLSVLHQIVDNVTLPPDEGLPAVANHDAESYIAQARNRLQGVSNDVWLSVRDQLLEGFTKGETPTELALRVHAAADVTLPRARMIARTEINAASNAGAHAQMKFLGMIATKEWLATDDGRCRESHRHADGQTTELDDVFTVSGYSLRYPGDPLGPAGEIINCRCTVAYDVDVDSEPKITCSGLVAASVAADYCVVPTTHIGDVNANPDALASLTSSEKQTLFELFMSPKPISPAYGGAKIHKQLDSVMSEIKDANDEKLSKLTRHDLLGVIDQQYKGSKFTFTEKYNDWLASPAGKKVAPALAIHTPSHVAEPAHLSSQSVSADEIIQQAAKAHTLSTGDIIAEGTSASGTEWRIVVVSDDFGEFVVAKKHVGDKWVEAGTIAFPDDLEGLKVSQWKKPLEQPLISVTPDPVPAVTNTHIAETAQTTTHVTNVTPEHTTPTVVPPAVSPAAAIDPLAPPPKTNKGHIPILAQAAQIDDIPDSVQEAFYQVFKKTKVTAVWSGNKIHESLKKAQGEVFLNDHEALLVLDKKFAEHGGSTGYFDKMVKWESSSAGKKVLGELPPGVTVAPATPAPTEHAPAHLTPAPAPASETSSAQSTHTPVATEPAKPIPLAKLKETITSGEPYKFIVEGISKSGAIKYRIGHDGTGHFFAQYIPKGGDKWKPLEDSFIPGIMKSDMVTWKSVEKKSTNPSPTASTATPVVHIPGPAPTTPTVIVMVSTQSKKGILEHWNKKGKLLNQSSEVVYDHLQEIKGWAGAYHGVKLNDLEMLRIIDAEKAASLGVDNVNLYEKKIVEWLKKPESAAIAEKIKAGTYKPAQANIVGHTPYEAPLAVANPPKMSDEFNLVNLRAKISTTDTHFPEVPVDQASTLKAEMDAASGTWTSSQSSGLRYYTSNNYITMNNYLRGFKPAKSNDELRHIKNAQAGMRPSTRPITVYRGTGKNQFGGMPVDQSLVGKTLHDEGFMSTSVGNKAAFGGKPVRLTIECPTGTPMAFVKPISHYPNENEMLLAAGTKYEVMSVTEDTSGWKPVTVVRVRVIP